MTAFQNEYRSVLKRIKSLERQNQLMKFFVSAAIVIFATIGCTQAGGSNAVQETVLNSANPDVLELRQLIIKDENQNVRLKIDATDSSNFYQSFYDTEGNERGQISIDAEGSARFRLFDTEGSPRFAAVTFSDEHTEAPNRATVAILGVGNQNTSDNGGIFLSTDADGTVTNSMYGKDGALQLGSVVLPDGTVANEIFDANKVLRFNQTVFANGILSHGMYDGSGTVRNSFNISDNDNKAAEQLMLDSTGRIRFSNFTSASDNGQQNYDQNGVQKTSIVISEDNSFSYYVEKNAVEQIGDATDWLIRLYDLGRVFSGNN